MYRTEPDTYYWQDQAMEWLPRILGAIAILLVAWILARAAKWAKLDFELPVRAHRGRMSPEPRLVDRRGAQRKWKVRGAC